MAKAYSNSVILNNEAVNTYVYRVKEHRQLANDLKDFLTLQLRFIMGDLKINRYLIGGTAALIMCYDIPIRKEMKDIDVIVPEGTIERIRVQIKNSPFYSVVSEHKNYHYHDNENSHIEIKCIQGFAVDIVETKESEFNDMYSICPRSEGIDYCPLINILEVKNKWRRPKDLDDLFFIEKWFGVVGIDNSKEELMRQRKRKREEARIRKEEEENCQKTQEPSETATFESINKMFDDLKEAEIEEKLKDKAPYGLYDMIEFVGRNYDTGKKEIAKGIIIQYSKKCGKITLKVNNSDDSVCYEVEKWIADLLK